MLAPISKFTLHLSLLHPIFFPHAVFIRMRVQWWLGIKQLTYVQQLLVTALIVAGKVGNIGRTNTLKVNFMISTKPEKHPSTVNRSTSIKAKASCFGHVKPQCKSHNSEKAINTVLERKIKANLQKD